MLNESLLAEEFPLEDDLIYLNHAAVAPWPARTAGAVKAFAEENIRLGASQYATWIEKEQQLREQLQRLINASSCDDIALLKNTSEGISIVASGIDWRKGDNVVSSDEEFPSNRIPWEAQKSHGVEFRQVNLKDVDPEATLMTACDDKTRVLTISSVQYASGLKLDLQRLGRFCKENKIFFCVDAIQSLGAMKMDVQANYADFVIADGHKWMLGPEGIALFYSHADARAQLSLHQYGWHMVEHAGNYDNRDWRPAESAKRFECGSNNLMGIHALSASISLLEDIGMDAIETAVLNNTAYLIAKIKEFNDLNIISPENPASHAGIVSFSYKADDNEALHKKLLERRVICAHRGGGIRFSPHFYTASAKLDKAIEILSISI